MLAESTIFSLIIRPTFRRTMKQKNAHRKASVIRLSETPLFGLDHAQIMIGPTKKAKRPRQLTRALETLTVVTGS
jgi:hypothetical protein